jgi:hypothetical protein
LIRLTIGNLDNQSHVLVVAEFEPTLRRWGFLSCWGP